MSLSRLSLLLRVPLVALIFGQLAFLGGTLPPDDSLAPTEEISVTFEERDDNKPFDAGLPVVIFEDALIRFSGWVLPDLGHVSPGATLELHATGPPNA